MPVISAPTLDETLLDIVDTAIAITASDFGNIQLLDSSHTLRIVAQRGFPQYWLDYWESVSEGQGTCGTSLKSADMVVVEDVRQSPIFSGKSLEMQLSVGVIACLSIPIFCRAGKILGMFSTHYKRPYRPDEKATKLLRALSRQAADSIELHKLHGALNKAIAQREDFISMASHELKTPLTALKLQNQLYQMLLREGKLTPERIQKMLDQSADQLARLEGMLSELMDITSIRLGVIHLKRKMVNLGDVIRKNLERFPSFEFSEKCKVQSSCDLRRLEQILVNLLTNAQKYGLGKPVVVELDRIGNEAVVRVIDHGIGISEKDLTRIFNRFERCGTKTAGGLGLGLYIAKQIAEAMGGTIRVESELGKGSTFTATLPISTEAGDFEAKLIGTPRQ